MRSAEVEVGDLARSWLGTISETLRAALIEEIERIQREACDDLRTRAADGYQQAAALHSSQRSGYSDKECAETALASLSALAGDVLRRRIRKLRGGSSDS